MFLLSKIAWRNLWRNKRRTILTVTSVSLGLALMLVSLGIGDGSHKQMIEAAVRMGSGHVLIQARGYQERDEFELTLTAADKERIESWLEEYSGNGKVPVNHGVRRSFVSGMLSSADGASGALVTGVEPVKEKLISSFPEKIVVGSFFEDEYTNPAVIGKGIAEKLELEIGDKAVLMAQGLGDEDIASALFRICGIIDSGTDEINHNLVLVSLNDFQRIFSLGNSFHQYALFTDNSSLSERLAWAASQEFPDLEVLTWAEALPELRDAIELDDAFNYFFQGIIFVLIAFTVMNTLLMSVLERKQEFSLLDALGMSPSGRFRMVMGEAFLISVLAVIAGFLIGFSVHSYFKHVGLSLDSFYDNEMDFGGVIFDPVIYSDLSVGRIAGSILAVFCLTVILAIIPAVRAARAGDVHLLSSN